MYLTKLTFMLLFACGTHGYEIEFLMKYLEKTCLANLKSERDPCPGAKKCPVKFKKQTCFEETCPGTVRKATCPVLFFYDNATIDGYCMENGEWNISLVFTTCTRLSKQEKERVSKKINMAATEKVTDESLYKIYAILSWISFTFMVLSLIILFYFMDKKNTRFNLHKNLIIAFLLRTVTFFVHYYGNLAKDTSRVTYCNIFWVLNRLFAVSEVAWMLNEALFLLKLLFRTFDAKSYFWCFFAFGWGFPALLVFAVYVPVMVAQSEKQEQRLCWHYDRNSYLMFILYAPMTLMLVINFCTLIYVIRVLLQKLRTSTTSEILLLKKGIKAALILMPLLGVIYLMILYFPQNPPLWYNYLVRVLYPMQGTLACLFYVIFNGEVMLAIKSRWKRWQTKSEFVDRVRSVVDTKMASRILDNDCRVPQSCANPGDNEVNTYHLSIPENCENGYITLTEVTSASTSPIINGGHKTVMPSTDINGDDALPTLV